MDKSIQYFRIFGSCNKVDIENGVANLKILLLLIRERGIGLACNAKG
jgi:hypothetical protein